MDTYKVAIIGTGFGTKVQAPAFQADQRFEVVALAGRNTEKTKQLASNLEIPFSTGSWKEVLKEDVDLISVATPPYLHYEMAKQVLKSGKHLLLEKPTTSTAYEAKKLYRYARDEELVGLLSHEFRFLPERAYIHDLLQDGAIGKVREVHLQQFYTFGAASIVANFGWFWRSSNDGGILGALGSHLIDWVRYTLNEEFVDIQGQIYTRVPWKTDNYATHKVTADDGFSFNFTSDSGITGTISSSGSVHHTLPSRLVIGGEDGTLMLDGKEVKMGMAGETLETLQVPEKYGLDNSQVEKDARIPPYMKLLEILTQSLDKGVSLSPSLYDGWKNQQILDAVKLSNQTGTKQLITD
ncbi:MAG: Gfo/Idh/MocA family oxidoreductase [Candidatus Heimdallarchaeota archaeon]|nr:Gfo/Idh/MocA family oxidoreductase [Candidatus Heimdallarchaeota archaeon]